MWHHFIVESQQSQGKKTLLLIWKINIQAPLKGCLGVLDPKFLGPGP